MATNAADPDLLDALASELETSAGGAATTGESAVLLCQQYGHWYAGTAVSGQLYGADTWGADWAASLRERASLLRAYHEIAGMGAGSAGGAGPALGAGYRWALNNGDESLSFADWYNSVMEGQELARDAEGLQTLIDSGASASEIATWLEANTDLSAAERETAIDLVNDEIPADIALASATGNWQGVPGGDPADYEEDEIRLVFSVLGMELPEELTPEDWVGIDEFLGALPDGVLGKVFNVGQHFEINGAGIGIGTPGSFVLPGNAGVSRQYGAAVSLSDQRFGPGFQFTHKVDITVQYTGSANIYLGKSTIGKIYGVLKTFKVVPGAISDAISGSRWSRLLGLPVSFSYSEFAGVELAYEATITPEMAAALAAGDGTALPDILDPASMEPGTKILIRGGAIEGSEFALTYKLAHINETYTEFSGMGFGIEALGDGRFAIYTGPIEAIESDLFVGIRKFVTVGLGNNTSFTDSDFTYAEIDLNTPEGSAAFADFISGSGVPTSPDGPGVLVATVDKLEVESVSSFEVGFGGLGWGAELGAVESDYSTITYSDGTQLLHNSGVFGDDAAWDLTAPIGSDGQVIEDDMTLTLWLSDIDSSMVPALVSGSGGDTSAITGDNQHIEITLTATEAMELQALAESVALEYYGDDFHDRELWPFPTESLTNLLAQATSPGEVVDVLIDAASWDGNHLANDLMFLAHDVNYFFHDGEWTGEELGGTVRLSGPIAD